MNTVLHDLRFALRTLVQRPGFSLVIIATLALGIGANAAIFSVINAVVLKPLPFHDPDRLVHIWENYPKGSRYRWGSDQGFIIVRPGTYYDWKSQSRSFQKMAALGWRSVLLTSGPKAEMLQAHEVDEDFFSTLGVAPIIGRAFQPDDFKSANPRIAILSNSLWQQRFAGNPALIGKTVLLDDAAYVVVGIMPEGFYPTRWETPRLWLPMHLDPALKQSRVAWKLFIFARLKPKVRFEQAQQEMDVISDRLTAAYPSNYDNMSAVLTPVTGYLFSQYERLFFVLLGAVGLVLLIACANVSNLLLARAAERAKELSIRAALGASRWRLIQQLLTESLLLAGGGAAIGTMLAWVGIRPILALLPASSRVPRIGEVRMDVSVLVFALCVSALAGLVFGIVPALRASRADLNESLKEGGRSNSLGLGSKRISDLLIMGEVALSLVLLVGAGLLMRSFLHLLRTDPGFNPEKVIALSIRVPTHRSGIYETGGANPGLARLFEELERRLRAVPGVKAATVTGSLPLRHGPNPWAMHIVGKPAPPPDPAKYGGAARNKVTGLYNHGDVSIQRVTPGYFETFGIPLLRGRYFNARDTAGAPGRDH
jgi:putative ABC transport system permease protein